ncbi:MAG: GHKL domain-containing protein [Chloroflexi bacterium]|nr:GHKL domain-containing protein [Chloroflexota bacterium]
MPNAAVTHYATDERASDESIEQDFYHFESDKLTKEMLDAVPDLVLVLNQQRQIVYANESCLQALHLATRHKALGQRPGEMLGCTHAREVPGGCGTSEFCATCGAVKAIISSLKGLESVQECRISLHEGDALDLRVWARPLLLDGKIYSVFSLQDISSEKRRHALERIFFHDILNVAGIIASYSQVLEMYPDEAQKVISVLNSASERLIDEITAQKNLLAAENGDLCPESAIIEVRTLVEKLVQQYHTTDRPVVVAAAVPDIILMSDFALLGRVLGNMLKNAVEASKVGDTITFSYSVEGLTLTFAVHNPVYIPRDTQLQIFKRSFSTKGSGRGLGTYSMKILSERYLHGRVWFESTHTLGTTFYAAFPLEWPELPH